jgi:hypothetical protein
MDTHLENPAIPQLRELYNSSPAAREILNVFSDWKENKKVTSVKRVQRRLARKGSALARQEIVQIFEAFHSMGLGEFITGDGVARPRFVWGYPLLELPRVASGESWELEPLHDDAIAVNGNDSPGEDRDEDADDDAPREARARGGSIKHIFRLREDFSVKMRLPADLTAGEAFRLADFIKTLPFGL